MDDDSNDDEEEQLNESNRDYDLDEEDEVNENHDPLSRKPPPFVTPSQPPAVAGTLTPPGPSSYRPLPVSFPAHNRPLCGGGREDCWSEGATDTLIDAWGERYLHLSRGNLKHNHWREVADAVTSRENYRKNPKTDIQCKNRIDTLKKKYKIEKAKIASGGGPSTWIFFSKLDRLIGEPSQNPRALLPLHPQPSPLTSNLPVSVPTRARSVRHYHADSDGSTESLPAGLSNGKKRKPGNESPDAIVHSVRELTKAIEKFGEVYERVERTRLKRIAELEKQRMSFLRDLDLQRMQFFMKTQMEINGLRN